VTLTHVYSVPGTFAIYYSVNFGNGTVFDNSKAINVLTVGYPNTQAQAAAEQTVAYGHIELNASPTVTSQALLYNPVLAFAPGSNAEFNISALIPAADYQYSVIGQNVQVWYGDQLVNSTPITYSMGSIVGPTTLSINNMQQGYYIVNIETFTAELNSTTGAVISPVYTTHTYTDILVFPSVAIYHPPTYSATGSYTNMELETGGFKSLDPAIEYDTVSSEILANTLLTLFGYNQTGSTPSNEFIPILAAKLPTTSNGGINTNYANYSAVTPWGAKYTYTVAPFENYTVYINNNTKWQDGTPVTAWDVYYHYVRVMLFNAGSPGTPGWIQSQFLLPGNYYASQSFYNITTNMTYNNATNSITFHFQNPVPPQLFYETFGQAAGDNIGDAAWLISVGAGIHPWNQAGFSAYMAHGNQGDYFTYVQYHTMADGPYMIDYIIPAQEVVLTANPYFVAPNPYFPAPHIKTVYIEYIAQPSTTYLGLKSGQAQTAGIPTSDWNLVEGLKNASIVNYTEFSSLSIFWYNFNLNVNLTMLSTVDSKANLPQVLFTSLRARETFAYAYNYQFYLNEQVGNGIYHVAFASAYAGMLPAGMLYQQSISQLNATTNGVPYFNLAKAQQLWASFVNTTGSYMGITYSSSTHKDEYNGAPLDVPIFIFSADPVDLEGATTWGTNLQSIIPGFQFQVIPTAFPILLGYMVQGQNPMPIYELGWAPDYPYPTDYLGPMGLPVNASTYPGPNDMTPYWLYGNPSNPLYADHLTTMQDQAANLTAMINDWNAAASNPSMAEQYYHAMNEMLVNMTYYTYIEQVNDFWVYSTKMVGSQYSLWEESTYTGMSGDLLYNYMQYAS
jgi:peptide/nickel transport system substrate-binding protein